jgi:hypothetical protein
MGSCRNVEGKIKQINNSSNKLRGEGVLDTSHWAGIASKMYHLDTLGVALQGRANGHQRQTTPLITA